MRWANEFRCTTCSEYRTGRVPKYGLTAPLSVAGDALAQALNGDVNMLGSTPQQADGSSTASNAAKTCGI